MDSSPTLGALLLTESRYRLVTEYRTKIRAAVEALPADKVWWRPNEQSNSVGNLLVHLNGNIRQWILAGIGGQPDLRTRFAEFATRDGRPAAELLADLERTLVEADGALARLPPPQLLERRIVQGRDLTVLELISQVVQHVALHTGQIIVIAKLHAPGAVRFTEDSANGLARPLWKDLVRPISPTSP
jgi:uncharacterized damage-inducible protein DinB